MIINGSSSTSENLNEIIIYNEVSLTLKNIVFPTPNHFRVVMRFDLTLNGFNKFTNGSF